MHHVAGYAFSAAADGQHLLGRLPEAAMGAPKVATFRNWVLAEVAEDVRRLKALA
jgi:hypothetical protein